MRQRAIIAGVLLGVSVALMAVLAWQPERRSPRRPLQIPPPKSTSSSAPREPAPRASDGARYSPVVRVNVTPDGTKRLRLAVDGAWELRAVGSTRPLAKGNRLEECDVTATASGFRFGKTAHAGEKLELHAASSPSIWVDDHQYRGDVRLFRHADGTFVAINVLPLEDYVASVVDSEMPAAFGDEARKAQAIVARTYALWRLKEAEGHPEFELFHSSRSQKYLGFQYRASDGRRLAGESDSSRRLTRETTGVVCTYEEQLFCTYYCAVCGGKTTAGRNVFTDAADPLQSCPCDYCREAELYRWSTRLSRTEAGRLLRSHFTGRSEPFGQLKTLKKSNPRDDTPGATFVAGDGQRMREISAVDLRRLFPSLSSPFFTVRDEDSDLVFEGRGHGHGAGMCQWGAKGLAATGKDCYDILRHYYQGVSFVTLAPSSTK